jgi:hypothetical protein
MNMDHIFMKIQEVIMANLQIKTIKDGFYKQIKLLSYSKNRSVSQQVLHLLRDYMAKQKSIAHVKTPAQVLLDLCGSWDDPADADQIIVDLKSGRVNSKKMKQDF